MNLFKYIAAFTALLGASTGAFAQAVAQPSPTPTPQPAAPPVLPETVVSAKPESLTNPSISTLREQIAEIPGAGEVIDAEYYKYGRSTTVKDALDYAPGVFVQPRFGAEEARISIRGSGIQRTFHGRGLKLLQDGVPINLADGSFDFLTMGYALRHVADLETTFREYRRVLRPGGKALILEVTKPEGRFAGFFFRIYFGRVYPWLTQLFTRSRDAREMMRYYWETMDACVPPESVLAALQAAGFTEAKRVRMGGLFSEYVAVK